MRPRLVLRGRMGTYGLYRNPRAYGLSVGQGKTTKLYPLSTLARLRVINDDFEGTKIVVVYDATYATGAAFERGDRTFSWKKGIMIDEAGVKWDLIKGTSGKSVLTPIPSTIWLSKRWRGFYPKSEVYGK